MDRRSPELVVSVSHLVRSQFGHQDFDDSDENEEVDLEKRRESKMSTLRMMCVEGERPRHPEKCFPRSAPDLHMYTNTHAETHRHLASGR